MRKVYFVTGTDTDAGKTTVTCGLLSALTRLGVHASAIKPVQTGCTPEGLAPDVERYQRCGVSGRALQTFRAPCSPHLAAALEKRRLHAEELAAELRSATNGDGITLVEGAGGLYVPLNEKEYLLDLLCAAGFPVLLVIGNRLGCLNHALLSLDALEKSGLSVAGMVLCRTSPPAAHDLGTTPETEDLILADNAARLQEEGRTRNVPLLADIPWDAGLADWGNTDALDRLADRLETAARHLLAWDDSLTEERRAELLDFDRRHLWHPYTSALNPLENRLAVGAHGCRIRLGDGRELIDGMSSWWCKVHGYGNRHVINAMQRQCASLSHVMFGGLTHEPAVRLGQKLLSVLPAGLEHLFYADSGSVAVEVAMKMALQYAKATGHGERTRFVALRGAYHGDTLGAMSLCDPVTGMHGLFRGALPQQIFAERPACRFPGSSLMHGERRTHPQEFSLSDQDGETAFAAMNATLRTHAHETAAVVVEPVVQGAGGMWFYHPGYLKKLRALCDELDVLLVADEIATGFGRTGRLFACEWAGITPDILCCGKALTGGMLTFSAVAATHRVAAGISNARCGGGAFMHGPTYMGNPLACATACASLDELLTFPWQSRVQRLEKWLTDGLSPCCGSPGVSDVRVLGAIGVIEMKHPIDVASWQTFFVEHGVWIRPFGTTAYIMPPLTASESETEQLCAALCAAVERFGKSAS
ncbi:adenosylmethionine--8-amino-7-oxononanoate transaminase [uncultured Mailhella sp.]|uniref:adenosylmethionine--8-amino-7-oxononanoate transaminase n=1 Tax=uncultured Mailhella sp. TaxID=1981031 RepID=UPI00262490CD|nr:adenosylmethionine--8-amino-7-oxononanoate transaminase [uncultured Mailhella sp.]